jgi:hypothetical protein
MRRKILSLLLIFIVTAVVVNGQNTVKKNNPVGTWTFEAPNAPEQYTKGSIVVGFTDKKYTASMEFTDSGDKFAGEKVKFEKDSLFFMFLAQGQDVTVRLKMEGTSKMSGKAVYSEGEVPLNLVKNAIEVRSETKK